MEYGCIGRKLTHSFSKIIHGKLGGYGYELIELEPSELQDFMEKREFRAINVTIPYKQDVVYYLSHISDRAREIGAVNTVVNRGGKLYGYNTDFSGMSALAKKAGIDMRQKKVVILGSGGTSKTAAAVARAAGAAEVLRVSRTAKDGCIDYETLYRDHADCEILINTTPCGMYPSPYDTAADIGRLPRLCGVLDAVYNPLRTELVTAARARGISACGGLYMLVAQAAAAAELFTGGSFVGKTDGVYDMLAKERENIVLIGMPGCGKTSVGRAVAKKLGRRFIDTDKEIEKRSGLAVPALLEKGEALFRDAESEAVKAVAAESGLVIATGGGAVLREQNRAALKLNGRLCFIDRPLESLPVTDSRPLSNDRKKLRALYDTRLPVYRGCADLTVSGAGGVTEVAARVMEAYGLEG